MDNKMKVINLILGKYHNKEMPKHIIINRLNYFYNGNRKTYESEYGEQMSFDFTDNVLNMEVEVVEEQEEIDVQEINLDFARLGQFSIKNAKGQEEILEVLFIEVQEKMKELARKINYLDKNIKEKQ